VGRPQAAESCEEGVAQRCLICTTIRKGVKAPPPLHTGHVCAILGYDAKKHHVTVFDPTGIEFSPDGKASFENGYEVKAGVMMVPYKAYVAVFDGIGYEDKTTKAPAEKRKK
jgi:hypothetical protein